MLCKIAELYVDVPEAEDLVLRCREYRWDGEPDGEVLTIREDLYDRDYWKGCTDELISYMESGQQFGMNLVYHSGMRLHASAVAWNGRAYLFSAPCGTGKSTHRQMWQQLYGEDAAVVFNDDKPAIRQINGKWYAFGTPWCGKNGINRNMKVPLGGICFLQQAPENRIRRMTSTEVVPRVIDQTNWRWRAGEDMILLLDVIDKLVRDIPVFLLECTPTVEAAKLSSETMSKAADEAGL